MARAFFYYHQVLGGRAEGLSVSTTYALIITAQFWCSVLTVIIEHAKLESAPQLPTQKSY
jgi:hypothetical protein